MQNKTEAYFSACRAPADTARYCLCSVCSAVVRTTKLALAQYPGFPVVFSGGVASNSLLREACTGFAAVFAPPQYSTDNAMASRKVPEAMEALHLIRNANRVSSFCNDVIGDICGVISGSASAVIAARVIAGGSTGAELIINLLMSAGGPIVEPLAKNLLITPICAHAMLAKSIVIGPRRVISLKVGRIGRHNAFLSVDGGRAFRLNPDDVVTVKSSDKVTRLLRLKNTSFFEILNNKFIDRQRY